MNRQNLMVAATGLVLAGVLVGALVGHAGKTPTSSELIVQASTLVDARMAVAGVGGEIERDLGIVNAVSARLSEVQVRALSATPGLRLMTNAAVQTSARRNKKTDTTTTSLASSDLETETTTTVRISGRQKVDSYNTDHPPAPAFPALVQADEAHASGITGAGVTIAVLDTGFENIDGLQLAADRHYRVVAGYNAIDDKDWTTFGDASGHGTHVTSIAINSDIGEGGVPTGVAPNADLVFIKAFDGYGNGTYVDVIAGLDWLLQHHEEYGVRVLNLSFSAPPRSHYWDDPINQAVMRLWQAGVTVVASAGNGGPDAMTIGVPGNTPYVITVGAMSDSYTADRADDVLTSFSAAGPTHEGFVKPEVVAPGGHITAVMWSLAARIAQEHPEYQVNENYFRMSGTSQSTAVVSGIAALMLEAKPWLTPDDVKCQLMASARPARTDSR